MAWLKDRALADTDRIEKIRQLHTLSQQIGISLTNLALCWCLKNPNVTSVILGASKVSQLEDNLKCLDELPKLTTEVMDKIEVILQNKPVLKEY